jgi:hypothetical protein
VVDGGGQASCLPASRRTGRRQQDRAVYLEQITTAIKAVKTVKPTKSIFKKVHRPQLMELGGARLLQQWNRHDFNSP